MTTVDDFPECKYRRIHIYYKDRGEINGLHRNGA